MRERPGKLAGAAPWLAAQVVGLWLLLGAPANAMASAPEKSSLEVRIDIRDLDTPSGALLGAQIIEQLEAALRDQGYDIVARRGDALFEVRISPSETGARDYDIGLALQVRGRWQVLVEQGRCEACSDQRLMNEILTLVPDLDQAIAELQPTEEEPPPPKVEPPEDEPPLATDSCRRGLQIGSLGLNGVVLLSAGLVTAGAGGLLMSLPLDFPWDRLRPQDVGLGLLIAGASTAAAGLTAVVVDLSLVRRCCRENGELAVAPLLGPTRAGISITGSF